MKAVEREVYSMWVSSTNLKRNLINIFSSTLLPGEETRNLHCSGEWWLAPLYYLHNIGTTIPSRNQSSVMLRRTQSQSGPNALTILLNRYRCTNATGPLNTTKALTCLKSVNTTVLQNVNLETLNASYYRTPYFVSYSRFCFGLKYSSRVCSILLLMARSLLNGHPSL